MNSTVRILQEALQAVERELENHRRQCGEVGSESQLSAFADALTAMLQDIEGRRSGSAPIGMGHVIADSWPLDSELGDLVAQAEQAYVRATGQSYIG